MKKDVAVLCRSFIEVKWCDTNFQKVGNFYMVISAYIKKIENLKKKKRTQLYTAKNQKEEKKGGKGKLKLAEEGNKDQNKKK